jgi:hypothetical protein
LAARAFLQTAGSSPEKSSVVALLTTGTPHKGSRLGRIYGYLASPSHPRTTDSSQYWKVDWDVADFILNYGGLDVRFPTINDLSDDSTEVAALNAAIGNLPPTVSYGAITYTGVEIGLLKQYYGLFKYSIFANSTQGNLPIVAVSSQAEDYMLDAGIAPVSYLGDGTVPLPSQRYDDITGFPATKIPPFPHTGSTVHTEETGQKTDMDDALKTLIGW